MKRYLEYIKGDTIYSTSVTWVVGVWSVWTHILAKAPDINGNIYLRIILAAISIAPCIAILNLYRILTKNRKRRVVGIISIIILAGASRGFALAVMFNFFGITENYNFNFRVPNGLILISFAYIIATILVAVYREQRDVLYSLRAEKSRLLAAASELRGKRLNEEEQINQEINESLLKQFKSLDLQSNKESIYSLQKLINDFVRPISHNLASQIPKWTPEDFEVRADRITLREVLIGIKPEKAISIKILTILMLLQTLPFVSIYGLIKVLQIEVAILILLPITLKLAQVFIMKVTSNYSTPLRLIAFFAFLGISTLPSALAIRYIISDSPDPFYFLKAGPSFTILAAGLIVTASALQTATKNIRTELHKTNEELRWIIARKNLVIWNLRGSLSRNLHGPVQSAIQVSVFDLRKALETEIPDVDLLERIQNNISTAIYNLDTSGDNSTSIQAIFQEVIETWKDHCRITIDLPSATTEIVSKDPAARIALVEIVREFINNAIRHAHAENVHVLISLSGNIVSISVTNDGVEFKDEFTKGLGLGLLDSIALRTSINRISDKTVVFAEIPILI